MAQPRPPAGAGVVQSIEVVGAQRIDPDTVRSFVLLRPGDPFDADLLDRSLRTLFRLWPVPRCAHCPRRRRASVVTVEENPIVNRVAFEGNRAISSDNLAAEVQLRARSVFTPQAAAADRQRILDLYARRGYFGARVEPKIIALDQNRVDVVFEITDGEAARVQRIVFVGNRSFSDWRLSAGGLDARERDLAFPLHRRPLRPGPPGLRPRVAAPLLPAARLRRCADYRRHCRTAARPIGFVVTYTIEEGTRYRLGPICIDSRARGLEGETLRRFLTVSEGDWHDGQAVERSAEAIGDAANLAGFPSRAGDTSRRARPGRGRIDLVFEITDGPRAFVERIEITGNSRTQDRVIRREMRLAEGDAFIAAQVRRSQQRIRDLGYFSQAEITASQGSAPDRVNLNVQVTERATGELRSAAATPPMLASLPISAFANATSSAPVWMRGWPPPSPSGAARWISPSPIRPSSIVIWPRAWMSSSSPAICASDIARYQERRQGFAIRMGYEFNERLRQTWAYTLVRRNVFDIQPGASLLIQEQAGVTTLSQIGQTPTYDARDSRLEPRDGYVLRFGTDLAGLGGDVAYLRTRLEGAYYIPLEAIFGDQDYVLAFLGTVGYLQPIGNRRDRIIDRFFLGGENLRGFRIGGAGPRDILTRDTLGGRFLWTATTEFRFPAVAAGCRAARRAFVDVGALSRAPGGPTVVDDGRPRVGVGFGFSWRSPDRADQPDFAQAVVRESYDETQVFRLRLRHPLLSMEFLRMSSRLRLRALLLPVLAALCVASFALLPQASAQQQQQQQWFVPGQPQGQQQRPAQQAPQQRPAQQTQRPAQPNPAPLAPGQPPPAPIIGLVDVEEVQRNSIAFAQVRDELERRRNRLNEDLQREQQRWREEQQALAAARATLPPEQRCARASASCRSASPLPRPCSATATAISEQAAQQGLGEIQQALGLVIQQVAMSRNVNIVLPRQVVVFNMPGFDLTDAVTAQLNTVLRSVTLPPDTSAAAATPAPAAPATPRRN